jgi:hypothetical protein
MKRIFKYIVSLLCVFAISISSFAVPASAADAQSSDHVTFWEYVSGSFLAQNLKDWWENFTGSQDPATDYNTYVSGLQTDLGSCVLIDGGVRVYFPFASLSISSGVNLTSASPVSGSSIYGFSFSVPSSFSSSTVALNILVHPIRVPFDAVATSGSTFLLNNCTTTVWTSSKTYSSGSIIGSKWSYSSIDDTFTACSGLAVPNVSLSASFSGGSWIDLVPSSGTLASKTTRDITATSRPAVITGSYVSGDGNTTYKDVTIVNETDKSIYNPVTGATTSYNSWAYDYSDRSYTLTATDGSTAKVVYGDDNVTINQGDTATVINYYIASSSTDTGGSSSSGGSSTTTESIWDKIGNTLGSLIAGPFKILEAVLGKLLDVLKSLVDLVSSKLAGIVTAMLGWMDSIPQLFGGFTAFLAAVFPFFPQELWDIFLLGAALTAIIWIIKAIRGR